MKKLKTMIMSAAMLLGMGLVAVPQAMAGGAVFATYKLPFGLQFGEPIPKKAKFQFHSKDRWVASVVYTGKNPEIYKRGKTLGAQTVDGGLQSLVFFKGKAPKVMRGMLSKGMSTENLKKLLRQQGGKEITVIPPKKLSEYSNGFITAVFGPYLYAFMVKNDDGEETGLQAF
ncbi:MAG: hypothetical protein JKY53_12885, partial [Flavobacteriales bacterium]|nr:hypothetical protein [Flavobacteriales bacterium]